MRITKLHLIILCGLLVVGFLWLKEYYHRQEEIRKAAEEMERIKQEEKLRREIEEKKKEIEAERRAQKEILAREAIAVAGEYWKIARREGRDVSRGQSTLRMAKDALSGGGDNNPDRAWELAHQAIKELKEAIYSDKTYLVKSGDTLWTISAMRVHFSDGKKWKYIYLANKPKIKNPRIIYPRQQLTIPVSSWKKYQKEAAGVK